MITYIKGIIEDKAEDYVVIDNNGIGYMIFVSSMTLERLGECGEEAKIYTYMNVKEDSISLFGFFSKEELNIFNMLITVSGVGPKGALSFLSIFEPSQIVLAIISDDIATLSKAPGIGKKIAQRIVLELRDKFKNYDFIENNTSQNSLNNEPLNSSGTKFEAIEALTALGYTRSEAVKAINAVYDDSLSVEQLLKQSLKKMI